MKSAFTFELDDGRIIATVEDGEVVGVDDWNGNEASDKWFKVAQEHLEERNASAAEYFEDR